MCRRAAFSRVQLIQISSPISPESSSSLAFRSDGLKRHVWAYIRLTPVLSAAAIIRSHCSSVTANGVATMTCLPASAAVIAGAA